VIAGLSDYLLASFPTSHAAAWDVLHEKVTLVDMTLEVVHRILCKVSGLFSGANQVAQNLAIRLINLCGILDIREDANAREMDGVPSPSQLRSKSFSVAVETLRYLGDALTVSRGSEKLAAGTSDTDKPTYEVLGQILRECIETSDGQFNEMIFLNPCLMKCRTTLQKYSPNLFHGISLHPFVSFALLVSKRPRWMSLERR